MKTNKSLTIFVILFFLILTLVSVKTFAAEELGINEVLNSTLENNKKLLAAEQKLKAAEKQNLAAESIKNSKLKGEVSWQEEELNTEGNLFTTISYSKFLAESEGIKAQLDQAEIEYLIAELEYNRLREQILEDIIKQYYNLLKLDKKAVQQKIIVKEAESLYHDAEQRYQDSLLTKADLIKTEINLDQSRQNLKSIENEKKTAAEHFERLTGIDINRTEIKDEKLLQNEQNIISNQDQLLKLAFENRSDYQMQLLNSNLIEANLNYIRSEEKVIFSLGGEYNDDDGKIKSSINSKYQFILEGQFNTVDQAEMYVSLKDMQPVEESEWKVTAALSYEFADGGKKDAEIEAAKANLSESEIKIDDLESEIKIEIAGLLRQLEESKSRIKIAEKNLEKSKLEYQSTKNRYQKGAVIESNLLSAQSLLKTAETELIEAEYAYQLLQAEILMEVQSLYHSLNSGIIGGNRQ